MRVAAAQAASVWLDPAATTDKAVGLIEQAGREGVELLAFPETFLSGYPYWVMLGGGGRFGETPTTPAPTRPTSRPPSRSTVPSCAVWRRRPATAASSSTSA